MRTQCDCVYLMNCVKQLALQDAECASASASKDAPAASKAEKDLL